MRLATPRLHDVIPSESTLEFSPKEPQAPEALGINCPNSRSASREMSSAQVVRWPQRSGSDFPLVPVPTRFGGPVFLRGGDEDLAPRLIHTLQQRDESGAAARIEFAHDVVDEQDGRSAMDCG